MFVAAILVVGCGAPTSIEPAPSPVDLSGTWQLTGGTVDGAPFPIVADSPVTLTVEGSKVNGRSACNFYDAEIVVEQGQVRLQTGAMTAMGCPKPAMAAEAAFHKALARIVGAARTGEQLILSGPDVELTFDRLAPVPVSEIVGTDWVLESLVSGDVASSVAGDSAKLRLEAGGPFSGSTGCRTFSGQWALANGGIASTSWGTDETECPALLAQQDSHVVGVLERFRATVDGRQLRLVGDGGKGLVYRAD
jgi:heat shock protein HslJ